MAQSSKASSKTDPYRTRSSLLADIKSSPSNPRWWEFDRIYRRFIYGIAVKLGLNHAEAQDAVQEVELKVLKYLTSYDRERAPFRAWLRTITRRVVIDLQRKRLPVQPTSKRSTRTRRTGMVERQRDSRANFDHLWDDQWHQHLLVAAYERVKQEVSPRDWLVFDAYANKRWPVEKVVALCGVRADHVYLIKHRVTEQLKSIVERLKHEPL